MKETTLERKRGKDDEAEEDHSQASFNAELLYYFKPNEVEARIIELAKELMENHYLLDSDLLYTHCLRRITDEDIEEIKSCFENLFNKKILIHGKALTRENVLENENRNRLSTIIKIRPGLNTTQLVKLTSLNIGTVRWHLRMLEKFEIIRSVPFGPIAAYYNYFDEKALDEFHYTLNKPKVLEIMLRIAKQPGISFPGLLVSMDVPRSTLLRKVQELISQGFLKMETEGNRIAAMHVTDEYMDPFLTFVKKTRKLRK